MQTEMYGPSYLSSWKVSYGVCLNAMIMLDAADLGPLLQYQARIERMHERYGERTWALLYQADVRARFEELPRVRLELKLAHKAAVSAGGTTPYDDARPWNEALRVLADRDKLWAEEFMEPAILIAADKTTVRMAIDNDAVIDRAMPSSAAEGQRRTSSVATKAWLKPDFATSTGRVVITRLPKASTSSIAQDTSSVVHSKKASAQKLCKVPGAARRLTWRISVRDAWAHMACGSVHIRTCHGLDGPRRKARARTKATKGRARARGLGPSRTDYLMMA